MRKHQNGFGLIGIFIIVVVVGIIAATGWNVLMHRVTSDTATTQQSQQTVTKVTATDSAKIFSYAYPSNWTLQKYVWQDCCEGPAHTEPDWSKQTQPITLIEKSHSLDAAIQIDGFGPNAVARSFDSRRQDQFNTYTKLKLNGYDALYHVTDFVGPSAAEKYKDHEYIISNSHATESVRLQFRERYSNSTLNGEHDFNASALVPEFQQVAKSVKFLTDHTSQ